MVFGCTAQADLIECNFVSINCLQIYYLTTLSDGVRMASWHDHQMSWYDLIRLATVPQSTANYSSAFTNTSMRKGNSWEHLRPTVGGFNNNFFFFDDFLFLWEKHVLCALVLTDLLYGVLCDRLSNFIVWGQFCLPLFLLQRHQYCVCNRMENQSTFNVTSPRCHLLAGYLRY